jgi:hypothetical protein
MWTGVGWFTVLALWLSTAVYAATATGLVGPDEPARADDLGAYMRDYLAYRDDLFVFEQVENWSLTAALLAIAALSVGWLATADEPNRARARLTASALALGSVISAVSQVAYLGAEDRVLAVAHLPELDAAALATMIDAIGRTDDYVENLGYLLISAGTAAMAFMEPASIRPDRWWWVFCYAMSVGLIVIVVTSFMTVAANDLVLLAVGAVLAPVWVLMLARRVARHTG